MPAYRSPLRPDANGGRVALVTRGGTGIGRAGARGGLIVFVGFSPLRGIPGADARGIGTPPPVVEGG